MQFTHFGTILHKLGFFRIYVTKNTRIICSNVEKLKNKPDRKAEIIHLIGNPNLNYNQGSCSFEQIRKVSNQTPV